MWDAAVCVLAQRLRDDQTESLPNGLLEHHVGEALEGVHFEVADAGEVREKAHPARIRDTAPGTTVTLHVWRDRVRLSVPVVIQARPQGT